MVLTSHFANIMAVSYFHIYNGILAPVISKYHLLLVNLIF